MAKAKKTPVKGAKAAAGKARKASRAGASGKARARAKGAPAKGAPAKGAPARGARAGKARPGGARPAPAGARAKRAGGKARAGIKAATIIRRPTAVFPPAEPPAPPPPPAAPADDGQIRARAAVEAALDRKAEEPVILDVRGLSGVADYFVVVSADSERQAAAIADAVDEKVTAAGGERLGVEGRGGGGWVLLDFGSVVVHVFSPETRRFYDLEGLWADAPRVPVQA